MNKAGLGMNDVGIYSSDARSRRFDRYVEQNRTAGCFSWYHKLQRRKCPGGKLCRPRPKIGACRQVTIVDFGFDDVLNEGSVTAGNRHTSRPTCLGLPGNSNDQARLCWVAACQRPSIRFTERSLVSVTLF
jgi:hypothetical protein